MAITGESITDEQIRELHDALAKEADELDRQIRICVNAMHPNQQDPSPAVPEWRRKNRERCAELINARNAK